MNATRTIVISVLGVLGLFLGWYYYSGKAAKTFSWRESYEPDSEQPYGTYFIRRMLETYRDGGTFTINERKVLRQYLPGLPEGTDLIFIGYSAYLDSVDVNEVLTFMERGNDVFIATLDPPVEIINRLNYSTCSVPFFFSSWKEGQMVANFFHESLFRPAGYSYRYRFGALDRPYAWNSVNKRVFCSEDIKLVPLGYHADDEVDFFKIPHGEGNLYVHANPLVFTNYFMAKADNLHYANSVFSHLQGRNIVWDESSKLPFADNDQNDFNSPLYFIMEQPALKYAWWMILATVLLFVIFAAKRKQQIIPVLEPKSNTSLEFVTLISSLHYQNQDHLDMARKKMKFFLYFIRSRYGIQTSVFTAAHVPILAERSKVKLADINILYDRWNVIEHFGHQQIEEDRLIHLYTAIDHFYKHCK
jgi:hypothetical protein